MSKILVIAHPPPPLTDQSKIEAAHYRAWQFIHPILEQGHQVHLCTPPANVASTSNAALPEAWREALTWSIIPFHTLTWINKLQRIHDSQNPDCIIAINFDCCLYATKLKTQKPIWMDIYGDYLTIMQSSCNSAGSNRGMNTSINQMKDVLKKGDVFSVCGSPQAYALVGEIAMAGRLIRQTFGYEFTRVILPGSPPVSSRSDRNKGPASNTVKLEPGDFPVLWCGGYNTWTDIDTLFRGLEWAMQQEPRVQFISLGASTYNSPDNNYARLLNLIKTSPNAHRYHMLGWQPWEEIPHYYKISKVGLNIDALHYETILGTRTRLVEMIAAGLPVISSVGTELSYLLRQNGAALTFEIRDWQTLGEEIVSLVKNPDRRNEMSQRALDCASNQFSFSNTTLSLLEWTKNPHRAPDKEGIEPIERLKNLEFAGRAMVRRIMWGLAGLEK
jgi:glycosyltransferase involved in cell wall biosynthesis